MADYSDFDIAQPSDIQNLLRKKYPNEIYPDKSSKFLKVDNIIQDAKVQFETYSKLATLLKLGDEFKMLGEGVYFYVLPKHASIQTIWNDTRQQQVENINDLIELIKTKDVYIDANSSSIYHISYYVTKSGNTVYMVTNHCYRVLIGMKLNNLIHVSDLIRVIEVGSDGKVKLEDDTNVEDGIFYVVPKYAKLVREMMSGIKLVNKDGLVTSLKDDMVGYFNANLSYPVQSTDFYKTLEVNQDATSDQIKKAYRTLSFQRHPDKPGGSTDAMQKLVEAYETLSDPGKRAIYDMIRSIKRSGGSTSKRLRKKTKRYMGGGRRRSQRRYKKKKSHSRKKFL